MNNYALFARLVADYPTYETILSCVMRDGLYLGKIRGDTHITIVQAYEIAMAAVSQNGLALEFVSSEHFAREQYAEIVAAALAQNAAARQFVEGDVLAAVLSPLAVAN